ncbi:hypothetical protein IMCC3317_39170 [Kordia antarctica]|uniref:Uncharacterized protein n=1 Tax=Kordia antarctica TaxID=1218801 RepID=A0A7L4ZRM3_9FLAO|nr:hypothetical protein [Kordia antarctica]QHI38524.1 hypothetical protein IMCC3317_39170 [Kordia antarctica]
MKNLKFKKIKIAKINNLSMILGGNNQPVSYQQTVINNCLPDTFTCPPRETEDPFGTSCQTTNGGTKTLGNVTGGFAETNECGG